MTVRNLQYLFKPASIAVVGGGAGNLALDACLVRNLVSTGFQGPVMPVDPSRQALQGVLTYPDVAALPLDPELAVITRPLAEAPELIRQLGARGVRAAVLLTDQTLGDPALALAILDAARPHTLRIVGPDGFGVADPRTGVSANYSLSSVSPGHIGLVTQSDAVMRAVLEFGTSRGIGFSKAVSLGEKLDVDFGDMLDFLAQDVATRAILLHLEEIRKARKMMSAARIAARLKPVVVLKPHDFGENRVEDALYDAAFRRAGLLRVNRIEHLFNAVEAMATLKPINNHRLAILGNSRSIALLVRDLLFQEGCALAELEETTRQALATIAPPGFAIDNPLDLGDRAEPESYRWALQVLLSAPGIDGVLVFNAPTGLSRDQDSARAVAQIAADSQRPVLACWIGAASARQVGRIFQEHRIPSYPTPGDAVQMFARMTQYQRNQVLLMETPPSRPTEFSVDTGRAQAIIRRALEAGCGQLNEYETLQLLDAYAIPVVATRIAANPDGAAELAAELGVEVALKILSAHIIHKSDVGGVAFGLHGAEPVRAAAAAMLERVRERVPEAVLEGFMVQPLLSRGGAYELTVGVLTSRQFGPVLRFGHGGTETEVIADMAYALPPLNKHLARDLMSRTRIWSRLSGGSARQAHLDGIALTLLKVSQMVVELGELVELDINPLWVDGNGVLALDGVIRVAPCLAGNATTRLAIRPYPKELEESLNLPDGRELLLRPILPEDEPPLRAMVRRVPAEDLRLRFFQPIRELSHDMAARLTQIDYAREMALVITDPGIPGEAAIWGVVRMTADPDLETAEYAIIVDRKMTGLGLGPMLMRRIIDYAQDVGIKELFGEVLRENRSMLKLNRALGFAVKTTVDDPTVLHVSLKLNEEAL